MKSYRALTKWSLRFQLVQFVCCDEEEYRRNNIRVLFLTGVLIEGRSVSCESLRNGISELWYYYIQGFALTKVIVEIRLKFHTFSIQIVFCSAHSIDIGKANTQKERKKERKKTNFVSKQACMEMRICVEAIFKISTPPALVQFLDQATCNILQQFSQTFLSLFLSFSC